MRSYNLLHEIEVPIEHRCLRAPWSDGVWRDEAAMRRNNMVLGSVMAKNKNGAPPLGGIKNN
ncbi:unnamed protein product [Clavelina lepadiformis]|uniref:Uncharacterized protein n=1 Tax=Clavelina lepadiformis TaxID=159417 RepID=A0ABP0F191_CLALP